ncbi:MAG: hypothetical protein BWY92_01013 [Firmicutes bacterium ADurb.BinA052]|nr:MAG: hypothetical protein BWY92_01013 [Firmicutes bacterium ADurb.BinA052]
MGHGDYGGRQLADQLSSRSSACSPLSGHYLTLTIRPTRAWNRAREAPGCPIAWIYLAMPLGRRHSIQAACQIIGLRRPQERTSQGRSASPSPPVQIDVLENCVFRRNYYQNLTASLPKYPRGYIVELGWSSIYPRVHPRLYCPIYPRAYPRIHPRVRFRPNRSRFDRGAAVW